MFERPRHSLRPVTIVALGISALAVVSAAQGPAAPAAADLVLTVTRFFETADQYARTFRNLTVEETRILEEFDESGRLKSRATRRIAITSFFDRIVGEAEQ